MRGQRGFSMINFFNKILDFIFPPVCSFCGKVNSNWLCEECRGKLPFIYGMDKYEDKFFDAHIYVASYESAIREGILNYKFHRCSDIFFVLL